MINVLGFITMMVGLFFISVGTIGLLRLPDVLSRIHSGAKCDTLGGILCLLSLIIFLGFDILILKILLVVIFLWIGNPTGTNVIAKGVLKSITKSTGGQLYKNDRG